MSTETPSTTRVFVATPVRDGRVHAAYMMGLLKYSKNRECEISLRMGGSLPQARDELTALFLASTSTHVLFVDSDIQWEPEQVQMLIDADVDIVSGCYTRRQDKPEIPARLTGERQGKDGELWEAEYVPAGFLLIKKAVIERMCGAYITMQYRTNGGLRTALWAETFGAGSYGGISSYSGEDIAFCERWRKIGGKIWLHQAVLLPHVGEKTYMPIPPTGENPAIAGHPTAK